MEQLISYVVQAHAYVICSAVDGLFSIFGIRQLKGKGQHVLLLSVVLGCICILKKKESHFRDDAFLASCVISTAFSLLCTLWTTYEGLVKSTACRIYRHVKVYEKLRVLVYALSVVLAAFVVVEIADMSVTFVSNAVSEEVIGRLDDNIIEMEEDRRQFYEVMVHPATKAKQEPFLLYKFHRYPMEDVEMKCQFFTVWLSGAKPADYQVVWRRNGAPIYLTDRHKHHVSVREEKANKTNTHTLLSEYGHSFYEVNATLVIHLLRESEFGKYTCYGARSMKMTLKDFLSSAGKFINKTQDEQKKREPEVTGTRTAQPKRPPPLNKKQIFKNEFSQKGEFRLIKMNRKKEIIRAPASSILKFTTSYWHLSNKEDVEVDYSVNRQSYYHLCPDGLFHGCSKFLLLYWILGHAIGGRFGVPPLQLFTIWEDPDFPAEQFHLVHCLCENAFGNHNVKYMRKYYNSTSKQYELIEILHPHTLVVVPREQKMLHLFVNRSQCSPIIEQPMCQKLPPVCEPGWDFHTVREFAEAAVQFFHWIKILAMDLLFLFMAYFFRKTNMFLDFLGRNIRRLTLEGSMGFLSTAELMTETPAQENNQLANDPEHKIEEEMHYDIFLSYSEDETDVKTVHDGILPYLESKGLRVCMRERDIPANLPEIQSISTAMQNSERFVVFLSSAYFQDNFRKDFEAAMIIEAVCERPEGSRDGAILVIKLDDCETPLWLNHLEVHNWTSSCLTLHDHLLRLLKWLEPRERRGTVRSKMDAFLTVLPLLAVLFLGLLCRLASFV